MCITFGRKDWHCTPCNETAAQKNACPSTAPCLFNVSAQADPLEQHDLSSIYPKIVASMRATYDKLGEQACSAKLGGCLDYVGVSDQAAWVAQTLEMMRLAPLPGAGKPLVGPPPGPAPAPPAPPSPPGTPISPDALLGIWLLKGEKNATSNMVTVKRAGAADGTSSLAVSFSTDGGQADRGQHCWNEGTGTISANGSTLVVNASTSSADAKPACVRLGLGAVSLYSLSPTVLHAASG